MAKVSNPLIGISRGRVGGVVMYRRKGENIIREHVAQIDDKNTGQQSQNRGVFLLLIRVLALCKDSIASFFTPSKANQTPWSDCVGWNALNALTYDSVEKYDQYGLPYFDRIFTNYNIKHADLSEAPLGDFAFDQQMNQGQPVAYTYEATWDKTLLGIGGKSTDEVNMILLNTTKNQVVGIASPWVPVRDDESAVIVYPASWVDDDSLLIVFVRPVDHSLSPMQAVIGIADLANKLK